MDTPKIFVIRISGYGTIYSDILYSTLMVYELNRETHKYLFVKDHGSVRRISKEVPWFTSKKEAVQAFKKLLADEIVKAKARLDGLQNINSIRIEEVLPDLSHVGKIIV